MANRPLHDRLFLRYVQARAPQESWWIGLSHEEFYLRAKAEQERMMYSRFGQAAMLMTASDTSGDDDRWRRARRGREDDRP